MPARGYELLSSFKVDQRAGGSTRATQGWRHQNNPVRAVDTLGTDVTTLASVSPLPQTLCHFYRSFCWWARLLHPPHKTNHHLCSSTVDITNAEIHHSQELNKRETADGIPKNTMILEHMQKAIWCNKASYCCTVKACLSCLNPGFHVTVQQGLRQHYHSCSCICHKSPLLHWSFGKNHRLSEIPPYACLEKGGEKGVV